MTFKSHGNTLIDGNFNRDVEYVYVYTAFEMASTGVNFTRAQLVEKAALDSATLSGTNSIFIDGVEYTSDATYDNAYWTQQNLLTVWRKLNDQSTAIALSVASVDTAVTLDNNRLPGTATTFGTDMDTDTTGTFWYAIFAVESVGTQAIGQDVPNSIAAVTAVASIEAALTGADLFFNTTLADTNNEDAMAGVLAVGDPVDGLVSATVRNLVVAVSNTIVA